jgi:MSHA pilin protein MshA
MKVKRGPKGFTLIELVIVIVILGILAAVAIPKYVTVQKEARIAVVNAMAGGLRSAKLVARAKYMVSGDYSSGTVDMDGTLVTVSTGTAGGIPTADQSGIISSLTDTAGFSIGFSPPTVTFQPTNGGSATCGAVYTGPTSTGLYGGSSTVTTDVSGC